MPRDVVTRWNSTFDLLEYALKHRKAVKLLTQRHELGLRKFKLADDEWVIIGQLHSVLKVSRCGDSVGWTNICKSNLIGPQGCYTFLLALNTEPFDGHPGDELYQPRTYDIFVR